MDALLIFPENEEQLDALKIVMKAMNVNFQQKSNDYPTYVNKGIQDSLKQVEEEKIHPYTNIKKMLNRKDG